MSEITLFWPKNKTPFYRFVLDPVSDPDSNPDPKGLFRIRIGSGSGQKFRILTDPDPDPQHCIQHFNTSKISSFFSFFVGYFCPPGSRSGSSQPKWIRLASTILNYASPSARYLNWKQPGDPPGPKSWRLRLVRLNRTRARCRPAQFTPFLTTPHPVHGT